MAKRPPISFNTENLERTLKQSTGKGMDAFFSPPPPRGLEQAARAEAAKPVNVPHRRPETSRKRVAKAEEVERHLQDEKAGKIEKPKRTADTTTASWHRDTTTPRVLETMIATKVEAVRKAVKQVGKEAATHRFSAEEKQAIADIVYTYGRQGYRTSENEITRIALNWIVRDYQENGTESVLEQVLKALKE